MRALLLLLVLLCGCGGSSAQRHFDRGAAHFKDGELDDAVECFQKGLALEPKSAIGYNLLGMAYREKFNQLRESSWKDAEVEAFRSAVVADSTYWPGLLNLGASLYYLGKVQEAATYFRKALILYPENPQRPEIEEFIREAGEVVPDVTTG